MRTVFLVLSSRIFALVSARVVESNRLLSNSQIYKVEPVQEAIPDTQIFSRQSRPNSASIKYDQFTTVYYRLKLQHDYYTTGGRFGN